MGIALVASLLAVACIFVATRLFWLLRSKLWVGSFLYKWLNQQKLMLILAAAERRRAAGITMVACCTTFGHAARGANTRRREPMEVIVEALRVEREAHKRCAVFTLLTSFDHLPLSNARLTPSRPSHQATTPSTSAECNRQISAV